MPEKRAILRSLSVFLLICSFSIISSQLQAKPRPTITRYSPGSFEGEQAEANFQVRAILTSPAAIERDRAIIERDRAIVLGDLSDPPTIIEWEIFKPNVYAAEVFGLLLSLEGSIQVSFEGLENLTPVGVEDQEISPIEIWYAVSEQELKEEQEPLDPEDVIEGEEDIAEVTNEYSLTWLTPDEMNNNPVYLSADQNNFTSTRLNIWIKLKIDFGTRSCNYADRDGSFITVTLDPYNP